MERVAIGKQEVKELRKVPEVQEMRRKRDKGGESIPESMNTERPAETPSRAPVTHHGFARVVAVTRTLLPAIVVTAAIAALAWSLFALQQPRSQLGAEIQRDFERIQRDTAQIQSLRLASFNAGPIEYGDIRSETLHREKVLRNSVRVFLDKLPDSAPKKAVNEAYREYDRSMRAQFEALDSGKLTSAVHQAVLTFDGQLPKLQPTVDQMLAADSGDSEKIPAAVGTISLLVLGAFVLKRLVQRNEHRTTDWATTSEAIGTAPSVVAKRRRPRRVEHVGPDAASAALDSSSAIVFSTDSDGHISFANSAANKFFSTSASTIGHSIVGRPLAELCMQIGAPTLLEANGAILRTGLAETLDLAVGATDYARRFDAIGAPLPNGSPEQAQITGVIWDLHDATVRHEREKDLLHRAFHDPLTGLPNRALFRDRASHALDRKARDGSTSQNLCVLFIDLDGFKHVNDSLGHEAGDELIVEVAFRLSSILRPGDTLARLGGDEFAVLIEDPRPKLADLMAERLLAAIQKPIPLAGRDVQVGASIGLAEAGSRSTVDEMLRNADTAMYAAKDRGKNRVERFHHLMFTEAVDRLELTTELRRASESGQLRLNYQPVVDLSSKKVVGVEALLRWHHPTRGMIPPSAFIPMAEESGYIVEMGEWVLRTALTQMSTLADKRIRLSVNVSSRQLQEFGFVDTVEQELNRSGIDASLLCLEITESLVLDDIDAAIRRLEGLRSLGVRIAIDDFGTGYSSLSHLKRLPVDQLKIDRSFVSDGFDDEQGNSFVRAIIELATTLGLDTVAEGVEDTKQADWLQAAGCLYGQGYLYSRPMTFTDLQLALGEGDPNLSDRSIVAQTH